jgi:hypothetical protein
MSTLLKNSVKIEKTEVTQIPDMLIREYKQTRWVQNSDRIGKPDSLSVWYSIEEVENFLMIAKANGGDGIKLYFGAYPKDYLSEPEYAGRQTIITVATKSKSTESGVTVNKDIYLKENGRVKILSSTLPPMCPPKCSASNEGGMGDLGITIVDRGERGMVII